VKKISNINICVIGLGYVGLPLALSFSKKYKTVGYDINKIRINELNKGVDKTFEVESKEIKLSKIVFTNDHKKLINSNVFIVTVPTPIKRNKTPDMSFLSSASKLVSKVIKKGNIVIYESTVYPGATEDYCIPIIEKYSNLKFNKDFFCGYSPERINPGDKEHRIHDIKKVTSGSTQKARIFVDKLYSSIIKAGTHSAKNIKVAEAAKVIENTQRDVNIALINELAILFNRMGIPTNEVLEAAKTKWNFLDFKPGLVGGHCIGVDPYYLTYKAKKLNYKPQVVLAGRRINDYMATYIFKQICKLIKLRKISKKPNILILGITFKENCPDIRNSQVLKIIEKFNIKKFNVDVIDPYVDKNLSINDLKFNIVKNLKENNYDVVVGAVPHDYFKKFKSNRIAKILKNNSIVYDLKNFLPKTIVTKSL
tara:strand:+ start:404 stop:1675 length:1272 start_codon:yes stop_codon:yes gene_type:complete